MATTLRGLVEELDGTELNQALDEFGFADLLAEAPRDAVSALFTALGRTGSMSTSLQDVLLQPLAEYLPMATAEFNIVLPGVGADLVGVTDSELWRYVAWSSAHARLRYFWHRSPSADSWPGLLCGSPWGSRRGGWAVSIRPWP